MNTIIDTQELLSDRIWEAYYGAMGEEFKRNTHERVHWICSKVEQDNVLDVGCSQGLVSILLARSGKTVFGIDINDSTIQYAKQQLIKEPKVLKDRVEFVSDDFLHHDFKHKKFNVILLGEVIEHVIDPLEYIAKCHSLLEKGGQIILTTPFGINDFIDHKHTFYFSKPYKYLFSGFQKIDYAIISKWIGLVASQPRDVFFDSSFKSRESFTIEDISTLESHFFEHERALVDEKNKFSKISSETKKLLVEYSEDINRLESANELLKNEVNATQNRLKEVKDMLYTQKQETNSQAIAAISHLSGELTSGIGKTESNFNQLKQESLEQHKLLKEEISSVFQNLRDAVGNSVEQTKVLSNITKKHYDEEKSKIETDAKNYHAELLDEVTKHQLKVEKLKEHSEIQLLNSKERILNLKSDNQSIKSKVKHFEELAKQYKLQINKLNKSESLLIKEYETIVAKTKSDSRIKINSLIEENKRVSNEFNKVLYGSTKLDKDYKRLNGRLLDVESSIKFQLGHTVVSGFTSIKGFFMMPILLVKLFSEGILRYFEFKKYSKEGVKPSYYEKSKGVNEGNKPVTLQSVHKESEGLIKPIEIYNSELTDEESYRIANSETQEQNETRRIKSDVQPKSDSKEAANKEFDLPSPSILDQKQLEAAGQSVRGLSILDEISEMCWKDILKLNRLDKDSYLEQISSGNFHFAFLESCWNGNAGDWQYAFTSPGLKHENAQKLLDAISNLRANNVPIVFWNKEDPMHFDKYLPIAEKCDFIFTTDSNKIPDYKSKLGTNHVDVLPFAAEAAICNPINRTRFETESVCFAGAWYPENHDERMRQMNFVLPSIIKYNGAIYDRYSHLETDRYKFPDKYKSFIRPSVPFNEVTEIYKKFKVFLNVNTIIDSPTMMSRRVYEILASGTPVVSAPSKAIEEQLSHVVLTGSNEKEVNDHVGKLLSDEEYWFQRSHLGMREVFNNHTYHMRQRDFKNALNELGIPIGEAELPKPLVSIILAACRPSNMPRIIENLSRQNYENIEVIFALTPNFTEQDQNQLSALTEINRNIKRTKVIILGEEVTLGQCLNEAVRHSYGEYIAKFDDDNFYFENYLSDMLMPFSFGDMDVVGKESAFIYLGGIDKVIWKYQEKRHRYTKFVNGDAMVLKRKVFEKTSFPEKRVGEDTKLLKDIRDYGGKIYTADHFNFVKYRSANLADHTWKETEEKLMRQSKIISTGMDVTKARL